MTALALLLALAALQSGWLGVTLGLLIVAGDLRLQLTESDTALRAAVHRAQRAERPTLRERWTAGVGVA